MVAHSETGVSNREREPRCFSERANGLPISRAATRPHGLTIERNRLRRDQAGLRLSQALAFLPVRLSRARCPARYSPPRPAPQRSPPCPAANTRTVILLLPPNR